MPPSANITSGNSPNPFGLSSFRIGTECLKRLVTTSSIHAGSSCPTTSFILNLLAISFLIIPSCITHIPATMLVPDKFDIS